jgi:predicted Zn-dependent peptidase
MAAELALELLVGRSSPLYTSLMEQGLINEAFGGGHFEGAGYSCFLFSGESKDPDQVMVLLQQEIEKMKREGIDEDRFLEEKNAMYGRLLMGLDDIENCADWLIDDHFYGRTPFALIDSIATLDVQSVYQVLQSGFSANNAALSVVSPEQGKDQ